MHPVLTALTSSSLIFVDEGLKLICLFLADRACPGKSVPRLSSTLPHRREKCEREDGTRIAEYQRISEKYERECERIRANTSLMTNSRLSPVPLLTTLISSSLIFVDDELKIIYFPHLQ